MEGEQLFLPTLTSLNIHNISVIHHTSRIGRIIQCSSYSAIYFKNISNNTVCIWGGDIYVVYIYVCIHHIYLCVYIYLKICTYSAEATVPYVHHVDHNALLSI